MTTFLKRIGPPPLVAATLVLAMLAGCSGSRLDDSWQAPRLVVVVVVDQMRYDYLTRFADRFSAGLDRLSREGIVYTEAHHDHAGTFTAPGHATIATGVHPSKHGIVGNYWWSAELGRSVYAVEDTVGVLGAPDVPGSSSALLLRETLGAWLKRAQPSSKVYAIALKDRASLLMAGPAADAAYWMVDGRFVSSCSYLDEYPSWVEDFNASALTDSYFSEGWHRLYDGGAYGASREDAFPAEGDGRKTTFPHRFEGERPGSEYHAALWETPHADDLTFTFARRLVEEEELGADAATDLLMIGASAADVIGHAYGPFSQEVQDYYLRLDRMVGSLLESLDLTVGPANYLLALTSDHGAQTMPEELMRRGVAARRVDVRELVGSAVETVRRRFDLAELPASITDGLVLRFAAGAKSDSSLAILRRALAEELLEREEVADVYTRDELADPDTPGRPYLEAYRRSFHPERSPDLLMRYRENYLPAESARGTTHGSPYAYDSHVPLIFFHAALQAARISERARTVDLAPTLAALMHIDPHEDVDGRVLPDVRRAAGRASPLP